MSDSSAELQSLCDEGRQLLANQDDAFMSHRAFKAWHYGVTVWLDQTRDKQLNEQWAALPNSPLLTGGKLNDSKSDWTKFAGIVEQRLAWLAERGA